MSLRCLPLSLGSILISGWEAMSFEEFQDGHLLCRNGTHLAVMNLHVSPKPPTKQSINQSLLSIRHSVPNRLTQHKYMRRANNTYQHTNKNINTLYLKVCKIAQLSCDTMHCHSTRNTCNLSQVCFFFCP